MNGPVCCCTASVHRPKLVVLTGGPGAGKTAVLEVVQRNFCPHVAVLPEAAGIVFGGGFPRRDSPTARAAAQRAIAFVQRELERVVLEERVSSVALCDRGLVDCLAYWPGDPRAYWEALGMTHAEALARYAAVIHLRTPAPDRYNRRNPLRIETAEEAAAIDGRIAEAWSGHPRRFFVDSSQDFLTKMETAIALIRAEVPDCCRTHPIPELQEPAHARDHRP